jgi:DNA invertase Pin-like site-specific DNA recombinase
MGDRITVGYARVSKFTQSEEFDALEQQVARLKAAGVQELLVDIESGRSDSRKEFNRLLQMVKSGKIGKLGLCIRGWWDR